MKRAILWAIRLYQTKNRRRISPCIFSPTCSHYAVLAVERHGALVGLWLTARRLLRCNRWGRGGHDPVPERKKR